MPKGPLSGVFVLDLSRVLAGPTATQILGDLGADVIKVERRGEGDDTRRWGPPFVQAAQGGAGEASYYLGTNRNKRSIAIDIAHPRGAALMRDLACKADVLTENFKTGGLARYGLDYPSLAALNPRLVYCSITGFGQTGPMAQQPGYDFVMQAMGGLMSITGNAGEAPMKTGVAVTDLFTGVYASSAILAALLEARASGQGQHIDMALFDVQVSMLANQAWSYLATDIVPARTGNAHPSLAPYELLSPAMPIVSRTARPWRRRSPRRWQPRRPTRGSRHCPRAAYRAARSAASTRYSRIRRRRRAGWWSSRTGPILPIRCGRSPRRSGCRAPRSTTACRRLLWARTPARS
jgi:crotonobetainyl-CoA:carnitine CoA-transferase CaiB-like acyl-CoA transferase